MNLQRGNVSEIRRRHNSESRSGRRAGVGRLFDEGGLSMRPVRRRSGFPRCDIRRCLKRLSGLITTGSRRLTDRSLELRHGDRSRTGDMSYFSLPPSRPFRPLSSACFFVAAATMRGGSLHLLDIVTWASFAGVSALTGAAKGTCITHSGRDRRWRHIAIIGRFRNGYIGEITPPVSPIRELGDYPNFMVCNYPIYR